MGFLARITFLRLLEEKSLKVGKRWRKALEEALQSETIDVAGTERELRTY